MMINSTQNLVINDVCLIADSSPLIALAGVNRLNLLFRLYSRVIAPSAVITEILAGGQNASGRDFLDRASWLEHWTLEQTTELISVALGPGETEAIQLAKQLPNSRLLLDDHRARRVAEDLNLEIIGSAGILVQAKRKMLIREVVPILRNMKKNGYYIGDRVIQRAAQAVGETV